MRTDIRLPQDFRQSIEQAIIGMDVKDARNYCSVNKLKMRVIMRNGNARVVTRDYVQNRVNVTTVDGIVTEMRWG